METVALFGATVPHVRYFSDHFPARGWKRDNLAQKTMHRNAFPIISPQGDGNNCGSCKSTCKVPGNFSDHFPARGWKQKLHLEHFDILFRSFPRKGMETKGAKDSSSAIAFSSFSDHFPARGWKPSDEGLDYRKTSSFSDHFPARGWKHLHQQPIHQQLVNLFRSFPRKGMETGYTFILKDFLGVFFSDHFPARGWKPRTTVSFLLLEHAPFPIISPQGDGNLQDTGWVGYFYPFSDHFPARGWKQSFVVLGPL